MRLTHLLPAVLAGMVLSTAAADAETLTVIVYGGSFEQGWRKAVIEPFEKANPDIKVQIATGLTFQNVALMRAQKDNPQVDVMLMDEEASAEANAEGLFQPLTVKDIPHMAELYPRFRVAGDPYTKFMYSMTVIAYNTEEVKPAPTSWHDLWSPSLKGHLSIGDITNTNGLCFFLAANIISGGTPQDADPGFKAVAALKPSIVTYSSQHAQIAQLFVNGDIWASPWTSDRVQSLADSGQPVAWVIPKEGGILVDSTIGIAKGTHHLAAAQKYIDFVLSPAAQEANARYTYVNPVNQTAKLPPDVAAKLPAGHDGLSHAIVPDWHLINQYRSKWQDRWGSEITN